jgi:hypothetical protein
MNEFIAKKYGRVAYYVRAFTGDVLPYPIYRERLRRLYRRIDHAGLNDDVIDRVNYYNKLSGQVRLADDVAARDIPIKPTYYYYDLKEHLNYFPRDIRIRYKFGDLNWVHDNANSVLLKLDKFRHFRWPADPFRFEDKKKSAVWRGGLQNPLRNVLVRKFRNHPRHDIGHVGAVFDDVQPRSWLGMNDQLAHRYMLSVEGYDVATNLKTILASQSLCLMPRPKFETWFMEGRLKPGVHYVELRDDFEDLDEKTDYYDRHEGEAKAIVAAANAHVRQFLNQGREHLVAILVLQKYFERTGQLPRESFSDRVFSGAGMGMGMGTAIRPLVS